MKIGEEFFQRDVLLVAPELLGQVMVRKFDNGEEKRFRITETEAYRGEEDLACHASRGRTKRTEALYHAGGEIYTYLIYGMYWLLNFVAGGSEVPMGVLVRGVEDENGNRITGSGRIGQLLKIDKSFYGEKLSTSQRIWIEAGRTTSSIERLTRVGIDYSGDWANKLWRYRLNTGD